VSSAAVSARTATPLARARRSCSRRLRLPRSTSGHAAGDHTGCSPTCSAGHPVASPNRRSVPNQAVRRPAARAAAANPAATSASRAVGAIGAPATTHARPVSTYATQASSPSNQ
jgi:hypothetical protein